MERPPDDPELERRVVRSLHIFVDPVVRECRQELKAVEADDFIDNVIPFKPKEDPEDLVA